MAKNDRPPGIPQKLYRDQLLTRGDLEDFKEDLLLSLLRALKEYTEKPAKRWLKSREVKKMLNISEGTLFAMRTNGTLPCTKIGNIIYYDADIVDEVLSGKRKKPPEGVVPVRRKY